ncbi:uncharacterized protein HMPREF1541_04610 [Cyphellophora europaea CBS 101466]|uniref:Uncharacterized protein n=1 Tax=Cyphellophora europaea (strain CBS 101466) TaxID=1220924 RepID=W2RXA5_CYPE1|nr:uncharacterized protein HMPREF1541_04610 [Cyphellophora europaea CBS 101466]ETN40334.1 hypothetical protein HMPREF1541_04610 [Cyphellophora europaea CBS 101466]
MAPPREDQTRKLQSPPRTTSTANQDRSKAMVRANTDEESSRSSDKENRQPMTSPLLDERTTGTSEASLSASMQDTSQDWRPEEPTNLLIESSTSPKPFTCRNCRSHHKKCLHAKDGTYEPALCKAFLKDLGPAQKVNSRTKSEMQQIRGAAGKCSSAKTKPTTFLRHDDDSSISNNAETRLDPAQYSYETVEGVAEQSDDDEPIVAGRRRRAYAKQAGNSTVKPSAETANIEGEGCKDRGSSVVQSSVEPLPAGRTTVCKSPVATQVEETRSRKYTSIKARANATRDAAAEAASPASAPEPNRAKTPPYQFLESSTLQPFPRPMVTATVERPGKDDQVDQVDVDISSVVSRLKDKGVVFEDDSSDDEVGESSSAREPAVLYPWQRKDISKDLYEIAPMLREISITDSTRSNFANTATSPRRSKKSAWRNLLHYQLQVRREKFGTEHPHRMVVARADSQKIKAVKLQDSTTQSWRHPLDPPQPEITQMTFDDFMGMPEDPIFEDKGGELVFRDGKREREWVASGAIRRTRNQGIDQRWHFMR